ncbi:MAG: DUF2878 domain-containing protein [Wenzhouxiangellaceae bacterium]|nr:DUF2878 domain-containing protein [Wenzhouxiangellaceae bacterium]
MSRRALWINQAFFHASWPACVIGAANGMLWPGLLAVGAFALWQLQPQRVHRLDASVVAVFMLAGLLLDSLWIQVGLFEYSSHWPIDGVTPLWLLLLWLALGLTVNHSLAFFRRRWLLFAALASVGSPLSYACAERLGAVEWTGPAWLVLLAVGPIWGVIVAALFRLAAPRPAAVTILAGSTGNVGR